MSFLGSLLTKTAGSAFGVAAGTAKTAFRAGFAPTAGQRLLNTGMLSGIGGVAGGIGAAVSDDSNNPNARLGNILRGAAMGAGAVATTGLGLAVGRHAIKNVSLQGSWNAAKRMYGAGKGVGKTGLSLASFAIQHPVGIAAAGAGIYGLSYATRIAGPGSPTMRGARVNTQYDRQAAAAQEMNEGILAPTGMVGTMPMMARPMQDALQNSTDGLVQGLNRGRHG